ncbi:MAG: TonB-dependent receptor plug domain-containing protein [Bacteroidales bacterium]|nr:TonB-dependent receptor plug domain-containing protein [Bacteroidales bacterium]MCI1786236.1 TonB-dependent receptor plug domain-containing protein [Bacteroidales bacterium]
MAAVMTGLCEAPADTATKHLILDGIIVSARIANTRTSSLRIVDIDRQSILSNAPGRTFPELIRNIPGVYSTAETGSFGDAKINIRGFKQENISILLNGIPISGLTSGNMYWNNWMGLAEATASIQVQKGIGNSMLSDNSVGGTVNILTLQPSPTPSSHAGFSHTGYGTNNIYLSVDSGLGKNGWAFSLMGAHNWGSSYVDCSNLDTWSYSVVVTKRLNSRNSINLTAIGSPERHQQRSSRLSYSEVESYGRNYNKNWGWFIDGSGKKTKRTLSQNTYFKPYFTLTHSYDGRDGKDCGIRVVSTVYAAFANGGGYYSESTGSRIASFQSEDGQIDWDEVYGYNENTFKDGNGARAQNIMTDYLAGHTQLGLKSSVIADISSRVQIDAGVHYQIYRTWEKEKITDLLGADYWYEDYTTNSLAGLNGRDPVKKVGDYVRTNNGREQHYITSYIIGTFKIGPANSTVLTLGTSVSGTRLRRWDTYNYSEADKWSSWTGHAGASVKAGVLHRASNSLCVYSNAAVYSRSPYASVFFPNGNNTPSKNITNEKDYLGEAGVRKSGIRWAAEATAYIAYRKDKTLMSSAYKSLDEDPYKYMVKGLDALHYGVEANVSYRISRLLKTEMFASIGEWKWKNDVNATIFDPQTMRPVEEIHIYSDGLHVGDAPQTQIGAILTATLTKGFFVRAEWNFNDRIWADFDPVTRTTAGVCCDSYRLPGYNLLSSGASWQGHFRKMNLTLFLNINNITDESYIERSKDGAAHDKASFTGYWGNGRNCNFGAKISFQ